MRPGQRELRLIMVVGSRKPGRRRVALRTDLAEVVGHMVGIIDPGVICLMTGITFGRDILVPGGVAGNALNRQMRPC